MQQADDHLDGGGLPRAVGSEEAEDLAAVNVEGDVVDGDLVAVAFEEVAGGDEGGGHGGAPGWRLEIGNWRLGCDFIVYGIWGRKVRKRVDASVRSVQL